MPLESVNFFLYSPDTPKPPVNKPLRLRLYDRWRQDVNGGVEYIDAAFNGDIFTDSASGRPIRGSFITGWAVIQ